MTIVVPFDGSQLAEAALVRAAEFGTVFDEQVVAMTAVPEEDAGYARERGWLGPGEPFDAESILAGIRRQVADLYPPAKLRHVPVDRYASSGAIGTRLRREAREIDASMVVLGSENAGRLVSAISSVGASLAAESSYDVLIVRQRKPAKIRALKEASPQESAFYEE